MSEDRSSNGQKSWLGKLTQAFAHEPKNRQELLELLREAHQNKLLDSEALTIVEGAIQVADLQVRDIMVPRSQMISIKATQSPREFLPAIIDAAHSRYPVIGESHDDVLGILLAKDLLPLILKENGDSFNIKDLLRPATFVPESKRLNVLLREFRANHNHMAVVIDEYGGVAGLVTIEDVLEPYLIQQGYIMRTPRGRVVTRHAYLHFGLNVPGSLGGAGEFSDPGDE
ncbi:MAG TPA: hypothetical protein DCE25_14230 [Pseudomonas sp.]|nr:hypothetical protein [Pseudomonas sp.]